MKAYRTVFVIRQKKGMGLFGCPEYQCLLAKYVYCEERWICRLINYGDAETPN
jgi:hypothetical protein